MSLYVCIRDELKSLKWRDLPSYTIIVLGTAVCITLNFFALIFNILFDMVSKLEQQIDAKLEDIWDKLNNSNSNSKSD